MLNLKRIFKKLFIILVIAQLVLLIAILIIYILKANEVVQGIKNNQKMIAVEYRNLFKEYLNKKFRLIIEDAMLLNEILHSDKLTSSFPSTTSNNFIEYNISNYSKDNRPYNSRCECIDKKDPNCNECFKIIAKSLFNKYLSWTNKTYVFIHSLKWIKALDKESLNKLKKNEKNEYNYYISIKKTERIGIWCICISEICFDFNYLDLYLIYKNAEKFLSPLNTSISIIYYDKTSSTPPLIAFNSKYFPKDLESSSYCHNSNSILNIFFKEQLDELYSKLNLSSSNAQNDPHFTTQCNILTENFLSLFTVNLYNLLTQNETITPDYTINNILFKDESKFLFEIPKRVKVIESNSSYEFQITPLQYNESIFLFPLMGPMSFNSNNSISFTSSPYSTFFIMIRNKNAILLEKRNDFSFEVPMEIIIFIFHFLSVNFLVWILFLFSYYYIFKGLSYPLKQIKTLYIKIGQIASKGNQHSFLLPANKISLNKKKKEKKSLKLFKFKFISFSKEQLLQKVMQFLQLEYQEEINNTMITLKAIALVIEFNDKKIHCVNILHNHDYNKISTFFEAVRYLSDCFTSKYTNKTFIDYGIIKLLYENLFIGMIKTYERQKIKVAGLKGNNRNINDRNNRNNSNDSNSDSNITFGNIETFYYEIMYAIRRARYELEGVEKGTDESKLLETTQIGLMHLANLETSIGYIYTIFKGKLFDELIAREYINKISPADNIEKEEKNLIDKLKKKELKEQRMNIDNIKKSQYKKENDSHNNYTTFDIKLQNEFTDDIKTEAKKLISCFEKFIELKEENKNVDILYENKSSKNVKEFIDILKDISIRIHLSKVYIICDEKNKGIKEYETAIDLFEMFLNKIDSIKSKKTFSYWKTTNFVLLAVNTIFYEKFLNIYSMLNSKLSQKKNELFINLNLLDLSPLYSKSIRLLTINKILYYLYITRKKLVDNSNYSLAKYKELLLDSFYIELQRGLYKMISLRNTLNDTDKIKKNILFVFDLNNAYIKDSVFKGVLFHYFNSKSESDKNRKKYSFFFTAFDKKLFLQWLPNLENNQFKERNFNKKYLVKIESSAIDEDTNEKIKKNKISYENEKIDRFFNFLYEYEKSKQTSNRIYNDNKSYRADKALYHSALFGFHYGGNNDITSSSKEANYIILMTNLSAKFTDNKENWKAIAELAYERKFTIIVILSYDSEIESYNNNELISKIESYKKFVKNQLIDGYLFIMRSLTHLKFILNTIFPITFNEFNTNIIKHYIASENNLNQSKKKNIK